jgi:hypothetical protein
LKLAHPLRRSAPTAATTTIMANKTSSKKAAKAAKKAEYMRMTTEGIKAGKAAATAMTNNNAEQEPKPAASPDVDEEGFKVVEKSKKTTPSRRGKGHI